MHIHFVCEGNTYRSRLAEAYLKSKNIPGVSVSSSGTRANGNSCGPICWEAQRILEIEQLIPFTSLMWQQTSEDVLKNTDYIVFMQEKYFETAKNEFGFAGKSYETWDIPDLDELKTHDVQETIDAVNISEQTFSLITKKVNELVIKISSM